VSFLSLVIRHASPRQGLRGTTPTTGFQRTAGAWCPHPGRTELRQGTGLSPLRALPHRRRVSAGPELSAPPRLAHRHPSTNVSHRDGRQSPARPGL